MDIGPAAYRRTYSLSRLAWSEGIGSALHSTNEPSELSQWLCHDDSTMNIVQVLLLLLLLFCMIEERFRCWTSSCILLFSHESTRVFKPWLWHHCYEAIISYISISQMYVFRLCILVYCCLYGMMSSYLAGSLHLTSDIDTHCHLRSADCTTRCIICSSLNAWWSGLPSGLGTCMEQPSTFC